MDIRIFQINRERDEAHVKFAGLRVLQSHTGHVDIDPGIYDEVFRGLIAEDGLEEAWLRFNTAGHGLHRGHSLSVSDVVIISGAEVFKDGAYFCDAGGWEKIDFDPALTQKEDGLLRIVMLEPGLPAYESYIKDDWHAMQDAVGGLFEITYPFDDSVIAVGNEEAKLIGMAGNRHIGGQLYAGPVYIVGTKAGPEGGECTSLTEEQAARYLDQFAEPEHYTKEEVEDSIHFEIITF